MQFFIIGVSHHQAPVAVREKFVGLAEAERHIYDRLAQSAALRESLVLSTCNRLEILGVAPDFEDGRRAVLEALADVSQLPVDAIRPYLHEFTGLAAARHLFRVAGSLDSLVLGEPQILGQVKEAFRQALSRHRAGPFINKLMHRCFRAAKRVRSETALAGGAVSVAGAAVALARSLMGGSLAKRSALILGAGPMAGLAAATLRKKPLAGLVIAGRTRDRAEVLARKYDARVRPWEELGQALAEADLVIAATGAGSPILTRDLLRPILAGRPERQLTVIDIGVPRNAAHDLKQLGQVVLRNIDDLREVVWESRLSRREAVGRAETIIDEEVDKFGRWLSTLVSQPTVTALTRKAERIRRLELQRTLRLHDFSPDQAAALELLTGALVRRLLHDPLLFIKSSAKDEALPAGPHGSCLDSIRRAFNIEPE